MAGRLAGSGVVGGGAACVTCAVAIVAETRRIAGNRVPILTILCWHALNLVQGFVTEFVRCDLELEKSSEKVTHDLWRLSPHSSEGF